ncbi:hypothetical protein DAT35_08380 [Vitiosangium sp. GDMCC 1.1324]|nr:hypothetical protein DAT35_08380 [Vitiosangium sp. GDMCC 1.1324]
MNDGRLELAGMMPRALWPDAVRLARSLEDARQLFMYTRSNPCCLQETSRSVRTALNVAVVLGA